MTSNSPLNVLHALGSFVRLKDRLAKPPSAQAVKERMAAPRRLEPDPAVLAASQTKSPVSLSARPEWNDDGVAADIVDDMYVVIFRFLEDAGDTDPALLRCVCTRWRDIIDNARHGLNNVPFTFAPRRVTAFGPIDGVEIALGPRGDVLELSRDEYDGVVLTITGTAGSVRTLEFAGDDFPLLKAVVDVVRSVPREVLSRIAFSRCHLHMTVFRRFFRTQHAAALVNVMLVSRPLEGGPRELIRDWMRNVDLCIHREHADPHLLPHAPLYDHQRHAAAWLKHMEALVVTDQAVASNEFWYRPEFCRGTSMAIDLSLTSEPVLLSDVEEAGRERQQLHRFEVSARGVLMTSEVSVGKTREVGAFLLGCRQEAPDVPEPRSDRLLYTRALDFGRTPSRLVLRRASGRGLVVTRAALVIVPDTIITAWRDELLALNSEARIVVLTNKRDHEQCTYADIAMADVVLVTRQFLAPRAYYRTVANALAVGDIGLRGRPILRSRCMSADAKTFYAQSRLATPFVSFAGTTFEPGRKAPLLHLFAWPRLVVDEIHEEGVFDIPEVTAVSARFTIGISATPASTLDMDSDVMWDEFLGLGFRDIRVPNAEVLSDPLSRARRYAYPIDERFPRDWRQYPLPGPLAFPLTCLRFLAESNHFDSVVRFPVHGRQRTYLLKLMCLTGVRAICWRNTQRNVERQVSVAKTVEFAVSVPLHPLQEEYSEIASRHCGTSDIVNVPVLLPPQDVTLAVNDAFHYTDARLAAPSLAAYADRVATLAASVCTLASSMKWPDCAFAGCMVVGPQQSFKEAYQTAVDTLGDFDAVVKAYFKPFVEHSMYADDVERLYGTKVSLLFRYLDAIHAHYPTAQCIVATKYVKVLGDIFKRVHRRPYSLLGAYNLAHKKKALESFRAGTSKVLLIDTTRAASGVNIPMADYVFFFDDRVDGPTKTQLMGRAARAGRINHVAVIHFKSAYEEAYVL